MVRAVQVLVLTLICLTAKCYVEANALLSKVANESDRHNVNMWYPSYTDISNFPFTVSVFAGLTLQGGGTLVKQNWVLTTASAVYGFKETNLRVRAGSSSAYTNGTLHSVTRVVKHPHFPYNTSYNIALLKLDSPVYPEVAKNISWLSMSQLTYDDMSGNVTGFGFSGNASIIRQPHLQVKELTIHNTARCNSYFYRGEVSGPIICTSSNEYFNLCYGDSGDPLTFCVSPTECHVIGIYTPIPYVCDSYSNYYSLFVDIGYFYGWITNIIGG